MCLRQKLFIKRNRLNVFLVQATLIAESRCGLLKGRGSIDMIFYSKTTSRKMFKAKCGPHIIIVD